jgi:hypothetical protein
MNDPTDLAIQHSLRFRRVSTRYPRRVAEAYEGDLSRAAGDSDEQVAATVAAWEKANRRAVRDWTGIGDDEDGRDLGGQG